MSLFDLLISRERETSIAMKIIGLLLLSISILGGTFILFEWLVPLIGFLESGGVVFSLLGIVGGTLLFMGRKKKVTPLHDLSQQAVDLVKDFNVEKWLKSNAVPITLLSLGAGITLSQFSNPQKLLEIYKKYIK